MSSIGVYHNLEDILNHYGITRKELREYLEIGINTITDKLAKRTSLTLEEATKIRDYIYIKTGEKHDIEFLFEYRKNI